MITVPNIESVHTLYCGTLDPWGEARVLDCFVCLRLWSCKLRRPQVESFEPTFRRSYQLLGHSAKISQNELEVGGGFKKSTGTRYTVKEPTHQYKIMVRC